MRVIAGEKRGLILYEPKNNAIRPTSDKVKGAIFNSIQWDLDKNSVFADLFGGSGAMSIEAISRGAKQAYVFDINKTSIDLIKKNISKAQYEDRIVVKQISAAEGINQLAIREIRCDFIFMDPPYIHGDETVDLMKKISEKKILNSNGIIMIEHEKSVIIPNVICSYQKLKEKKYGNTLVSFFREAENE